MNEVSTDIPVCKVCGKICSAHTVQFRWGIAHAGTYTDGRFVPCSERHAEHQYTLAQVWELETLVRSLRWNAGRMRTKGKVWTPDDLDERSNKAVKRMDMLRRQIAEYYPWTLKDN